MKFRLPINNKLTLSYSNYIYVDSIVDRENSLKDIILKNIKDFNLKKDLRLKLEIAPNVDIKIIDDLLEVGSISSDLDIILNENSKLEYVFKTDCLHDCSYFCNKCLKSELDNKINKNIKVTLDGQNAVADIKISYNGAGTNILNLETIQEHVSSGTKSNLVVKSALSQFAKLLSKNTIKINKDLKKIESLQDTKSLMFGCFSVAICSPILEVESQDVVCKHGAAFSRIDENQLFYMQSRGIDYCKAKELLINSFLH